jgi:hypothetical protein
MRDATHRPYLLTDMALCSNCRHRLFTYVFTTLRTMRSGFASSTQRWGRSWPHWSLSRSGLPGWSNGQRAKLSQIAGTEPWTFKRARRCCSTSGYASRCFRPTLRFIGTLGPQFSMARRVGVTEVSLAFDGATFLEPMARTGVPCGCPQSLADRKVAARSGNGPKPDAKLYFRLAEVLEAGIVHFSSSWDFFDSVRMRMAVLGTVNARNVRWKIRLQRKTLKTRSGMAVHYTYPLLAIAPEAVTHPGRLNAAT